MNNINLKHLYFDKSLQLCIEDLTPRIVSRSLYKDLVCFNLQVPPIPASRGFPLALGGFSLAPLGFPLASQEFAQQIPPKVEQAHQAARSSQHLRF